MDAFIGRSWKVKVLHYVDCASLSWGVPYIAHMKALVGLGVSNIKATQALNEIEINEDSKIENIIKQLLAKI